MPSATTSAELRPSQVLPGVQRSSQRCQSWWWGGDSVCEGFMAYGCGHGVAILGGNLRVVQYTPLPDRVTSVHFNRLGTLAVSHSRTLSLLAPLPDLSSWVQSASTSLDAPVSCVQWLSDSRLVVAGASISVLSTSLTGGLEVACRIENLGRPVASLACSRDGRLFSTTGTTDSLVKVWFSPPTQPCCSKCLRRGVAGAPQSSAPAWTFCYLRHPAAVTSMSWRPSYASQSVLMTSCADGVVRMWSELTDLDSAPSTLPLPMSRVPMFSLTVTVPVSSGSLLQWVVTLPSPRERERSAGKTEETVDQREAVETNPPSSRGPTPTEDKVRHHGPDKCPIAGKCCSAITSVAREDTSWLFEVDQMGQLVVWKFKTAPHQTPSVTQWSCRTRLQGQTSVNSVKSIVPVCFSFADSGETSSPAAFWLYVFNPQGLVCWWSVSRIVPAAFPARLKPVLHSQIFGHRNSLARVVPHTSQPWLASISTEQNIVVWKCDDTKPFEHSTLLRDVCSLGPYSLLAWVPSGTLFMVSVGSLIFVYSLSEASAAETTSTDDLPSSIPAVPASGRMTHFLLGILDQSEVLDEVSFLDAVRGVDLPGATGYVEDPGVQAHWLAIAVADGGKRVVVWNCVVDNDDALDSNPLLARTFDQEHRVTAAFALCSRSSHVRVSNTLKPILITGHADGMVYLWRITLSEATGCELSPVASVLASPSGHPITVIRAPYFGRFACCSEGDGDTVRIYELESSAHGNYVLEAVLPGSAHFGFSPLCDGEDMFAVSLERNIAVYSRGADLSDPHSVVTKWVEIAQSPKFSAECSALSWTFNGSLVAAVGQQLHVFSIFARTKAVVPVSKELESVSQAQPSVLARKKKDDKADGDGLTEDKERSVALTPDKCGERIREEEDNDGMQSALFRVALEVHHALPLYHPRIIEEYIRGGPDTLWKSELIFSRLRLFLEDLSDPFKRPTAVFPLTISDFLSSSPSSVAPTSSQQKGPTPSTAARRNSKSRSNTTGWDDVLGEEGSGFEFVDEPEKKPEEQTPEERLIWLLEKVRLPDLTEPEQSRLLLLPGVLAEIRAQQTALDSAGARFLCAYKLSVARAKGGSSEPTCCLSSSDMLWALISDSQDHLLETCLPTNDAELTWEHAKAAGVGFWLRNQSTLRSLAERLAKASFARRRDPEDCAAFHLAMGKKSALISLYRFVKDQKLATFFSKDFVNDAKNRANAAANAFKLKGQHRYLYSAAFFLLAGELEDATRICVSCLKDVQLALFIARLMEPDVMKDGMALPGKEVQRLLREHGGSGDDPFTTASVQWSMREHENALKTLSKFDPPLQGSSRWTDTALVSLQECLKSRVTMLSRGSSSNEALSFSLLPALRRTLYALHTAGLMPLAVEMMARVKEVRAFERKQEQEALIAAREALAAAPPPEQKKEEVVAVPAPEAPAPKPVPTVEYDEFGGVITKEGANDWFDDLLTPSKPAEDAYSFDDSHTADSEAGNTAKESQPSSMAPLTTTSSPKVPKLSLEEITKLEEEQARVEAIQSVTDEATSFSCALRGVVWHIVRSHTDTSATRLQVKSWSSAAGRLDEMSLAPAVVEFCVVYGYFSHESVVASMMQNPRDALLALLDVISDCVYHVIALPPFLAAGASTEAADSSAYHSMEALSKQLYPSLQEVSALASPQLRRKIEFAIFFGLFIGWWKRRRWGLVRDFLAFDVETVLPIAGRIPSLCGNTGVDYFQGASFAVDSPDDSGGLSPGKRPRTKSSYSSWRDPKAEATTRKLEEFSESLLGLCAARIALQRLESFFAKADAGDTPREDYADITRELTQWTGLLERRLAALAPSAEEIGAESGQFVKTLTSLVKSSKAVQSNRSFWEFLQMQFKQIYRAAKNKIFARLGQSVSHDALAKIGHRFTDSKVRVVDSAGLNAFCMTPEGHYAALALAKGGIREVDLVPRGTEGNSSEESESEEEQGLGRARSQSPFVCSVSPASPTYGTEEDRSNSPVPPGLLFQARQPQPGQPLPAPSPPPPKNTLIAMLKRRKITSVTPQPPTFARPCARPQLQTKAIDAHPTFPYYLSGGNDGKVHVWQFLNSRELGTFAISNPGPPINRVRFSTTGMRFGAVDDGGFLGLWSFTVGEAGAVAPFFKTQAHSKDATDLAFLNAGTVVATCGTSKNPRRNVCIWDTLLPNSSSLVGYSTDLEHSATCMAYSPFHSLLAVGDAKGGMHTFDIRKMSLLHSATKIHSGAVTSLSFDSVSNGFLVSVSSDGSARVWDPQTLIQQHSWSSAGSGSSSLGVTASTGGQQSSSSSSVRNVFRSESLPPCLTQVLVVSRSGKPVVLASGLDGRLTETVVQVVV